jgi:hypothetical protein
MIVWTLVMAVISWFIFGPPKARTLPSDIYALSLILLSGIFWLLAENKGRTGQTYG